MIDFRRINNWGGMIVSQIEIPEAEITDLCRRYGVRKLALFGSVLTSRFSDSSDVDFLVEFRPASSWAFSSSRTLSRN